MTSAPSLKQRVKNLRAVKKILKTRWYYRLRQTLPVQPESIVDDGDLPDDADLVRIDWPNDFQKPKFGIIQDHEKCPRWTKYRRFLKNNGFEYSIYDLHAHDWLEKAKKFDVIVGVCSCEPWHLQEVREKFYFLNRFLGIRTYPSLDDVLLFEDKKLEAYIAKASGIPFAKTFVSYDIHDALFMVHAAKYPLISKVVPSSGSVGVQMVRNSNQARQIVQQAFSPAGRRSHARYFRQKNFVYFQEYIPNDGYDIRVMVVGNCCFGYYRKVLSGDFRASGMGMVEKRALPEKAMEIAMKLRSALGSPLLVVDFVHALTGDFFVIEYSPTCQMETPEQLHVEQVPGAYVWRSGKGFRFERCRPWLHELALKEFLLQEYLGGAKAPPRPRTFVAAPA